MIDLLSTLLLRFALESSKCVYCSGLITLSGCHSYFAVAMNRYQFTMTACKDTASTRNTSNQRRVSKQNH